MSIYLLLINAAAFLFMFADKQFAKHHRRRIPEAVLLLLCAAGGSLGGLLGMWLFRHKTKKPKFYITVPLLLVIQLAALWYFTR